MNTTEEKLVSAMSGLVNIQESILGLNPLHKSIGERIAKSDNLEKVKSGAEMLTLKLSPLEVKAAITGTGAANDPLAPSMTPSIDPGTRRALHIRGLLTAFPTLNAAIEMPVKDTSTIGSPVIQNRENTALGEGGISFVTSLVPVETLGYWIPVSKQILEDAGTLDALVNSELFYGLALKIEDQLLNGDGTNSQLDGLIPNATAWTNNASPNITNEIDVIRSALKQVALADFSPNAILLNPDDWSDIETRKVGASDDAYAAGPPRLAGGPILWGHPVIESNSIASGTFLVGDFSRASILYEREKPVVEIAQHDGNNFTKGILTLRVYERLAQVVANPLALVTGTL